MNYQKNIDPETGRVVGLFRRYTEGDALIIEKYSVPLRGWIPHPGLAGWASAIGGADDFFNIDETEAYAIINSWAEQSE